MSFDRNTVSFHATRREPDLRHVQPGQRNVRGFLTVLAHMSAPDPTDYDGYRRARGPLKPEKRLQLAVLEDAIHQWSRLRTVTRSDPMPAQHSRRELLWWFTRPDHDSPFAFESVCDSFGFDPIGMRSRILSTASVTAA